MRKYIVGALAIAALAGSTAAIAQGEMSLGVFGSYWDHEDADGSWGIGAKGRFGYVELRGTYYGDADTDILQGTTFQLSTFPVDVGLAFNFAADSPLNPYIGAGGSYYFMDTNAGDVDDEVGWYLLVGGEMGMTQGLSFMLEGTYRSVEATIKPGQGATLITDSKLNIDGFGANAGVVWRF